MKMQPVKSLSAQAALYLVGQAHCGMTVETARTLLQRAGLLADLDGRHLLTESDVRHASYLMLREQSHAE